MHATLLLLALLSPLQGARVERVTRAPSAQAGTPVGHPGRPNVVFILADDFGVDLVSAYGEGTAPPCTPNLDQLADQGTLFRNAWANPVCSPTRAALMTGRFGFRTGIGGVVMQNTQGLSLSEQTLPELMVGYDSTYLGKWHLSGNLGNSHPNDSGFAHFAGVVRGAVPDYSQWTKIVDGVPGPTTTYATTDLTDDAIAALATLQEPYFLYMSYVAPHTPFHVPPASLCPGAECASSFCASLPPNPNNRQMGKAMVEAMDREIGRFLTALDATHPNTVVFFMGDNGTAGQLSEAPFLSSHAKGSVYEGGLNVPLVARGVGVVPGAESDALVSATDLFATFGELAGVASTAEDSISIVPYLANPALPSLRDWVYGETFPGGLPPTNHDRAVRNDRYKLLRRDGSPDEFYDLVNDPFETSNLLPGLTPAEQAAFDELEAVLIALGVD